MISRDFRTAVIASAVAATLSATFGTAQAAMIGFVAPLSGPQALVGQDQVDGFMLAVEQLGGKLGGQGHAGRLQALLQGQGPGG